MAATQQAFQAGNSIYFLISRFTQPSLNFAIVVEQGKAPTLPINFGQVYELDSWSRRPVVNSSSTVPTNSFGLETGQGVDAAAVISVTLPAVSAKPSPSMYPS
jgi:hypothetical protein